MIGTTLVRRLTRSFAALALVLVAQPGLATINCEILPTGGTTVGANVNDVIDVDFTVGGGGCGGVVTDVSIISDTTGSSLNPTSFTGGGGTRTFTATIGPNAGIFVFRVTCTTGCFGSPANTVIDYTVNVTVPVSLNLTAQGPTAFNTFAGASRTITVRADDSGVPASTTVTWLATGPVSLSATSTNTDASGFASVVATWGPGAGAVSITALRIDNTNFPVTYNVTVQPAPIRTLVPVNGNNQSGPTRTPASNPLIVEARDNGTPTPATNLTWAVVSGDAVITAADAVTGPAGQAQAMVRFGPTPGPIVVRVSRDDEPTAFTNFNLSSTLTRSIAPISGNGQSAPTRAPLANPLVVEARDNGDPTPGIGITWSVVSGDATLVSPSASTDAAGRAQSGVLFGATPGPVVVRATRADEPTATTDFTVTSTFSRTIALISGGNQQGLPGLPLPDPIVFEVRGNGVPEAGVVVDIAVQGDATVADERAATAKITKVTGADGRVSAVVTLGPDSAGVVNILASVPGSPGVSTTVAATANSIADLPGLSEPLREFGSVIETACGSIARIPVAQRTPEQVDLLARCQSFAGADPAQVAVALDELLPDTSLAMVTVALLAGQAQLDNVRARIAALRSGSSGGAFDGLAIAAPTGRIPVTGLLGSMLGAQDAEGAEVGTDFDRWGYFVSGTLGRGESDPGRVTPGFDFNINGLTAGVDYRFSDRLIGGASIGYTKQDTDLVNSEGRVDADGISLSAYATFYRDQSWYGDAVATWGRNDYETQRRIRYTLTNRSGTSVIDQTARGQLDGDLLSLAATVGRDLQAGGWTIGPYGRLLYSRIDFDAGTERISGGAGSGLALQIFPGTHTSFASVAGAKFSHAISRDWGILSPHLQVEWEHEYRDDPQRVGARFLADPNATRFSIEGDAIDSSFFRIGGGLSALFASGRSGFIFVEQIIGKSGFKQTNVALGIRGEF